MVGGGHALAAFDQGIDLAAAVKDRLEPFECH
jgi:hypothetical protein